jgi:hypothetical protein
VRDPLAADTHGIDRSTFVLTVPAPGRFSALLVHMYGPGPGLRLPANLFMALMSMLWLLPVGALAALIVTWRQSSPEWRGVMAMVIALQLAMNVSMLRDPLDTRARDVLVPTALLLSSLGGLAWSVPTSGGYRTARRALVVASLVIAIASAASLGGAPSAIERTQLAGRSVWHSRAGAHDPASIRASRSADRTAIAGLSSDCRVHRAVYLPGCPTAHPDVRAGAVLLHGPAIRWWSGVAVTGVFHDRA